ncbi:MAG: restriction endonuclease subunit S [Thermoguttaceae bacterium]|nr:restriction endonuclease subunit S [Thermoguttaceae bacterium]
MVNIWKDYPQKPLPDLLEFIVDNRGKTVPTVSQEEACEIVLIATNCIRNENLYPVYEKVRYISRDTYENWFRAHPQSGDIIFVNKGTPGRVCFCPENIDFCIAQDMMAFRSDSSQLYNKYLLALLRSRELQEQIRITSVGDTIPHFKKEFLKELSIPLPPLSIQHIIGDFYFTLSDKIELNNRINANLEQQAQAIFKSWFVDFEPFGGKMPKDWKMGTISDICCYSNNKVNVEYLTLDNYFSTENMQPNRQGALQATSLPNIKQTTACKKGDVLVSNIRPNFKKILYCFSDCGCSTDVLCFVPNNRELSTYLYSALYSDKFFDYVVAGVKGTKMPRGDKQQIMKYPIYIPTTEYFEQFNQIVSPMLETVYINRLEINNLSSLRDALVPKLMSGEINV